MNSSEHQGLPHLRNHLFLRAEHLWEFSILLAVGMLAVTIVGLWVNKPFIVSTVGLVALVFPVAVSWMREAANVAQLRADKCRRLILLSDGLGHVIAPAELAEVRALGLGVKLDQAPFVNLLLVNAAFGSSASRYFGRGCIFTERLQGVWRCFEIGVLRRSSRLLLRWHWAFGIAVQSSMCWGEVSSDLPRFLDIGDFLLIANKSRSSGRSATGISAMCSSATVGNVSAGEVRAVVEDHGVSLTHCPRFLLGCIATTETN